MSSTETCYAVLQCRLSYGMCGTDVGYAATGFGMLLLKYYEMRGTDTGYGATSWSTETFTFWAFGTDWTRRMERASQASVAELQSSTNWAPKGVPPYQPPTPSPLWHSGVVRPFLRPSPVLTSCVRYQM
eukprot:930080-Rhodomonas_salina.2